MNVENNNKYGLYEGNKGVWNRGGFIWISVYLTCITRSHYALLFLQ